MNSPQWSYSCLNATQSFKMCARSLSHSWLFAAPWTVALKAPLVCRISLARILQWVAISCSRGSSQPRDWTCVSCISCTGRWILYHLYHLGSTSLQNNYLGNQHFLLSNVQNSFGILSDLILKLFRSQTKKISLSTLLGTSLKYDFRAVLGVYMLEHLRRVKGCGQIQVHNMVNGLKYHLILKWARIYRIHHVYIPYTYKCLRRKSEI